MNKPAGVLAPSQIGAPLVAVENACSSVCGGWAQVGIRAHHRITATNTALLPTFS